MEGLRNLEEFLKEEQVEIGLGFFVGYSLMVHGGYSKSENQSHYYIIVSDLSTNPSKVLHTEKFTGFEEMTRQGNAISEEIEKDPTKYRQDLLQK